MFVVIFLSRFASAYSIEHIRSVKDLLRYVRATRHFAVVLDRCNDRGTISLQAWTDRRRLHGLPGHSTVDDRPNSHGRDQSASVEGTKTICRSMIVY